MATASEKGDREARTKRRKKGYEIKGFPPVGGRHLMRKEILAEAEKLVIKPGMKLVYDEELNMMVWR